MQIKNPIRPIVILDGSSKKTFKAKIRLMNSRLGDPYKVATLAKYHIIIKYTRNHITVFMKIWANPKL